MVYPRIVGPTHRYIWKGLILDDLSQTAPGAFLCSAFRGVLSRFFKVRFFFRSTHIQQTSPSHPPTRQNTEMPHSIRPGDMSWFRDHMKGRGLRALRLVESMLSGFSLSSAAPIPGSCHGILMHFDASKQDS